MLTRRLVLAAPALMASALLAGCAAMQGRDPVQVSVIGIEPLPSEGLELRFNVKLRVQNPNDSPIDFDGLAIELDVQGRSFATGVSNAKGTVPRFGETLLELPVSVSALRALQQIVGVAGGGQMPKELEYHLRGKIGGPLFGSGRFEHKGALTLSGAGAQGSH